MSARFAPFACFRLGDSSIIPARIRPGKPMPTRDGEAFVSTHKSLINCATVSATASIGMLWISYPMPCAESFSGNFRTGAVSRWPSTSPTAISSPARTPITWLISAPSETGELVQPVEGRRFVALGQCRIVEHRIHEIVDLAAQNEHRLPDMQQFARSLANNMNSENIPCLAMKYQ